MNKHILVTGGTGFLGSQLVPLLREKHRVTALPSNIADITDRTGLQSALSGIDFDIVLHLAACTHSHDPAEYTRVNVEGTKNLIEESRAKNARFVFMSSRAAVAGGGAYSQSELRAEEALKESGLNFVILQPAEVYGGKAEALQKIISLMRRFRIAPIIGNGEYRVAPVWIGDVLQATLRAIEGGTSDASYNLSGPDDFTYIECVNRIESILRLHTFKIHIPIAATRALAKLARFAGSPIIVSDQIDRLMTPKSADISTARADLAFNPISFEEGLQKLAI